MRAMRLLLPLLLLQPTTAFVLSSALTPPAATGRASSSPLLKLTSKKPKPKGFGAPPPPPAPPPAEAPWALREGEAPRPLDPDAAALLEEAGGDIGRARQNFVGYTLAYVQESDPALYEAIKENVGRPEAHEALVEVTWDAIAAFLPATHSAKPTEAAARRLTAIARAACDGEQRAILDVGCGNGLLLPFLTACGAPADGHLGIDLSSRMVALAEKEHAASGARFEAQSFADLCEAAKGGERGEGGEAAKGGERGEGGEGGGGGAGGSGGDFDAVIFNGSLQFFADPAAALAEGAALLKRSGDSRLVVGHLSGAAFVRREMEESPATVLSQLPSLAALESAAASLGMQVALPSFLGTEAAEIEAALDDFYLAILRFPEEEAADGAEA